MRNTILKVLTASLTLAASGCGVVASSSQKSAIRYDVAKTTYVRSINGSVRSALLFKDDSTVDGHDTAIKVVLSVTTYYGSYPSDSSQFPKSMHFEDDVEKGPLTDDQVDKMASDLELSSDQVSELKVNKAGYFFVSGLDKLKSGKNVVDVHFVRNDGEYSSAKFDIEL